MIRTLLIILAFAILNLQTTVKSGRPLPSLYFNENSATYCTNKEPYEIVTDTLNILKYVVKIMAIDSNLRIEITGHADSKEHRPTKLALQRVKKVYHDLKKIGADTTRLLFIVCGNSRPLISEKAIKRCRKESDSNYCVEQLRQKNRRVSFNLARAKTPGSRQP